MEDNIRKIYKKPMFIWYGIDCITLSFLILFTSIACMVLGSPFPRKVEVLFMEAWEAGWILSEPYLPYCIGIISYILSGGIRKWQWGKVWSPIRDILYQKCDADLFLQYSLSGIEYIPNIREKKFDKMQEYKLKLMYFEIFYVRALNAKGKYKESLEYLERHWKSYKKKKIFRHLVEETKLKISYEEKNEISYDKIYRGSVRTIKKNKVLAAKGLILQRKYDEAIEVLERIPPRYCYEKIEIFYYIAYCYGQLNNEKKVQEYIGIVIENGNNTMIKEKALELLKEKN